jgi:hypothetical protein
MLPGEAPMIAVGLRANELRLRGRDPQSIAFFSAPGIERLYSGETIRMPSADSTAALKSSAGCGISGSKSGLKSGRSPMPISNNSSDSGASAMSAFDSRRLIEVLDRLPIR